MSTIRRTNDEWRVLLAKQKASGQTQKEWCLANDINLHTMKDRAYRLRRLDNKPRTRTNTQNKSPVAWMEVCHGKLAEASSLATIEAKPVEDFAAPPIETTEAQVTTIETTINRITVLERPSRIQITRREWAITVTAGVEAEFLADVLRVVDCVCC